MEKGRKDVYLIQTMLVSLISACIIFGYFIFHVILYFDIGCLPSVSFFDLTYRGVTK